MLLIKCFDIKLCFFVSSLGNEKVSIYIYKETFAWKMQEFRGPHGRGSAMKIWTLQLPTPCANFQNYQHFSLDYQPLTTQVCIIKILCSQNFNAKSVSYRFKHVKSTLMYLIPQNLKSEAHQTPFVQKEKIFFWKLL